MTRQRRILARSLFPLALAGLAPAARAQCFDLGASVGGASDPFTLVAMDVDGDGDTDVITESGSDIVLFENADGVGGFGAMQVLIDTPYFLESIACADLDSDGTLDLLAASPFSNVVFWHAHVDGQGTFAPEAVISSSLVGASQGKSADLDGDGDQDVLAKGGLFSTAPGFSWSKNLTGSGDFGAFQLVAPAFPFMADVEARDVDGDGDLDLLLAVAGTAGNGSIRWLENDGTGAFPTTHDVELGNNPTSVETADIDGDGDLDLSVALRVIGGSEYDVLWYRNVDGLGTFGAGQYVATFSAQVGLSDDAGRAVDFDGDGDLDLVTRSTPWPIGRFYLHENTDGLGTFGSPRLLVEQNYRFTQYELLDIDLDADLDVVSITQANIGPSSEEGMQWYRNPACASPAPAAVVTRLGTPPNPPAFLPGVQGPVLCSTWAPFIDHSLIGPANANLDFAFLSVGPTNIPTALGTFLCDPSTLVTVVTAAPPGTPFQIPIPHKCNLVGVTLSVQGGTANHANYFELANALDITIGTSTL